MGHFKAHSKTLGPYQDRPFKSSRPQDRSSKNPKTSDRLVFGPSDLNEYGSATLHCKIFSLPFLGLRQVGGRGEGRDQILQCIVASLSKVLGFFEDRSCGLEGVKGRS